MNIENLKKAIGLLKTIKPEQFTMDSFREKGDFINKSCGSVGCIIGHCTSLDTDKNFKKFLLFNKIPDMRKNSFVDGNSIMFFSWAENFFDIPKTHDTFNYLFHSDWGSNPLTNTIDHAIYRLSMIITGYKPEELYDEINSEVERLELVLS